MTKEFVRLFAEVLGAAVADLEAVGAAYPAPHRCKHVEALGSIEGQSLPVSADTVCRPFEY
jgi:hypothetical protein